MSPGDDPVVKEGPAAADASTLRALEFPAVVEALAARTSFPPARELAMATSPSADATHVAALQDQTDEAVRLLEEQVQASVGGVRDIRGALERARRGGRLTPAELLDIGETLHATGQFAARLRSWRGRHLTDVRSELDEAPELREAIARSVDDAGEILDSASVALAAIRKRLRTAQERVRERLNAMLRSSEHAGSIGEAIVTMRNGRYVIPVRAEAKGKVRGIVHDQSSSGATLFVEPLGVVELNNAWTEAALAAEREEERILDELSAAVEARATSLASSLAALARADVWLSRARLAADMDAIRPEASRGDMELLSARHPLLAGAAVPIDVCVGDRYGYRALVITGPNTGGKTVSLKTLGLLSLMYQAGLRIPVAGGSRATTWRRVMADIGDEQSIAQSLSTFSSHLRNVVRFVDEASAGTLVLLDEVGAGTDPAEGSALAMAVIARLLERGATVAATTHYAELKTFAQTHDGVTNASVEFDVETLRPTYRLEIGLPGKSQAFAIAERLGLPRDILNDARSRLSTDHASMEETLAAIQRAEMERDRERVRAGEERAAAEAERGRAAAGVARARQEAAAVLREARRAAEELYATAEREVAEMRREATRRAGQRGDAREALERLSRTAADRRAATVRQATVEAAAPEAAAAAPRVGEWARSRTLGSVGRVTEISGRTGRVTLETGGARVVIPMDDLEAAADPSSPIVERDLEADELRRRAAASVDRSIDLRGERVEAALEQLEAYLDQVLLAGLDEIRIIHGAGTGALRRSIRELLASHPRVRATRSGRRDEGGDGATVVEL